MKFLSVPEFKPLIVQTVVLVTVPTTLLSLLSPKERGRLKDLDIGDRIILKSFYKIGRTDVDWTHVASERGSGVMY
jgi:hypothetical protein